MAANRARSIATDDAAASAAMARHGLSLVPAGARILTHCNTGRLVSAGAGTAFAVILAAHRAGRLARPVFGRIGPLVGLGGEPVQRVGRRPPEALHGAPEFG